MNKIQEGGRRSREREKKLYTEKAVGDYAQPDKFCRMPDPFSVCITVDAGARSTFSASNPLHHDRLGFLLSLALPQPNARTEGICAYTYTNIHTFAHSHTNR